MKIVFYRDFNVYELLPILSVYGCVSWKIEESRIVRVTPNSKYCQNKIEELISGEGHIL